MPTRRAALGIAKLTEAGVEPVGAGPTVQPRALVGGHEHLQQNSTECGPATLIAVYCVVMQQDAAKRETLIAALCQAGGVASSATAPTRLRLLLAASVGAPPLPLEALLSPQFSLLRLRNVRNQCFAHSALQLMCRMAPRGASADAVGGAVGRFLQQVAADDVPLCTVRVLPTSALPESMHDGQQHDPHECTMSWLHEGGLARGLVSRLVVSHRYHCSMCDKDYSRDEDTQPEPVWSVPVAVEAASAPESVESAPPVEILKSVPEAINAFLRPPPPRDVDCDLCPPEVAKNKKAAHRVSFHEGGVVGAVQVGQFLLVHLKRFRYGAVAEKLSHEVSVPQRLRVGRAPLRLVGAVSHSGESARGGHYVAYVEHRFSVAGNGGGNGGGGASSAALVRWLEFDDVLKSAMPLVSAQQATERMQGSGMDGVGQQPYLLLYERDGDDLADVPADAPAASPL